MDSSCDVMPWGAGRLVFSGGAVGYDHSTGSGCGPSTGSGCAGDGNELTAYQRAALVTVRLMAGERITTRDVMRICRLRWSGAYKLMGHLTALPEMPLILDDEGFWRLMER